MDAVILAAGSGSRLGVDAPKCLVEVGGRTLLHRQVEALTRAGVENIIVVVGYRHEEIRSAAPERVRFIYNEQFAVTNSMYSFHLARSVIRGDVVVLNSDVLFPFELLERVLDGGGSALAMDSASGADPEHMKVHLRGDRLVLMSKQLSPRFTHGENVGLLLLKAAAAQASLAAAGALLRRGHQRGWLAQAISTIARTHRICAVDIAGLPWVEIDYPEDLVVAREVVGPAITRLNAARPAVAARRADHEDKTAVAG
ncbi:MAG: NTP transferase domain-containing protein [Jatrophihabitans sp.]|uniref:phosphocholine cytidylyltransferase family protein n=1 Tax=Jatrophihabitans sp. TaxID=1932789 RepID=UPI00390F1337